MSQFFGNGDHDGAIDFSLIKFVRQFVIEVNHTSANNLKVKASINKNGGITQQHVVAVTIARIVDNPTFQVIQLLLATQQLFTVFVLTGFRDETYWLTERNLLADGSKHTGHLSKPY